MDVADAIRTRRAKRAIGPRPLEHDMVVGLVEAMRLSASCNNNQPWRVVICRTADALAKARMALSRGNVWASRAPLIMVISARVEDDCHISDRRDYFLFGCGLAVGQMLLRATEMGIVAHPIGGFDPLVLKREFGIPEEYVAITMVIIGYWDGDMSLMSDKQKASEPDRPERKPVGENFFEGRWGEPFSP